jgi:hypothetical protein
MQDFGIRSGIRNSKFRFTAQSSAVLTFHNFLQPIQINKYIFFNTRQPLVGQDLFFIDTSISISISSGWVISPTQRPLPDNTQHPQETDIHSPGGIRTRNLSKRAAADLRLRPSGHWDILQASIDAAKQVMAACTSIYIQYSHSSLRRYVACVFVKLSWNKWRNTNSMATVCSLSICALEMHIHNYMTPASFQTAVQMRGTVCSVQ